MLAMLATLAFAEAPECPVVNLLAAWSNPKRTLMPKVISETKKARLVVLDKRISADNRGTTVGQLCSSFSPPMASIHVFLSINPLKGTCRASACSRLMAARAKNGGGRECFIQSEQDWSLMAEGHTRDVTEWVQYEPQHTLRGSLLGAGTCSRSLLTFPCWSN